jgi:hypothetical protein
MFLATSSPSTAKSKFEKPISLSSQLIHGGNHRSKKIKTKASFKKRKNPWHLCVFGFAVNSDERIVLDRRVF